MILNSFGMRVGVACLIWFWSGAPGYGETLTLPPAKRPAWLQRDGIVMAGSWETLLHRLRRDGGRSLEPTPEQRAAYAREQSPEMLAELKALGVNFVMMHAYKGYGLATERESMADAVRFAKLCRATGLRVGVYNFSGVFGWDLFFKEKPEAQAWVVTDENGKPFSYSQSQLFRSFWNRNHPDAQSFYKDLVRFAVQDIQADLLHFDNYSVGPGFDTCSVERFRKYLGQTFTSRELKRMGLGDLNTIQPPLARSTNGWHQRVWQEFSYQSLADSYFDMTRYARSLRKDILVECNPPRPDDRILSPVDHGRILPGGEALWDEGKTPGYRDGILHSRIRTYKIGRSFENITFAYTRTPLEAAEAMAFNLDSLGCVCWFEYGKIVNMPESNKPMATNLVPFIRFFNANRDLFRETTVITDVAVLRSFPSQVFAEPKWPQLTDRVERAMIENRVPFQIIHDSQLTDLRRYRTVVLAGCVALSDHQIKLLKRYVTSGGRLCVIGPVATHDEWFQPRTKPGLQGVSSDRVARFSESDDCVVAAQQSCGGRFSLSVAAPLGLCAELTEQGGRRLVHLVNYHSDAPVTNAIVKLVLPPGKAAKSVRLTSAERERSVELAFAQLGDLVTFEVSKVKVHEIAVVEMR